jgi:succinate dehydrogenase hydrophobic anchor subunit
MEDNRLTIDELVQTDAWKKFMMKLEIGGAIFLGITIIMIIAGYTDNGNFRIILSMTLTVLSVFCFFLGFHKFDSESKILSYLFYKVHGYGLFLGFITILFIRNNWPYPKDIMTIVSIILILISLLLGMREKINENKNNLNWRYFIRIFVALIPLIYIIIQKQ